MIKRLLFICSLLFVVIVLKAQPYGNEWINYSQQYYKIKITQSGIYRIDSTTLASAGIDLSTIDPHHFQLFNKGIQQNIFIQGENDNVFNSGDFIEFYGEKNDGSLDALLYKNTSFLPNPYYSLANDTAAYFLTWNNSINGARMTEENDTTFSTFTPAGYFFKESIAEFHTGYYEGETNAVGGTDARYTKSEGWLDGTVINLGQNNIYGVSTLHAYSSGPNVIVRTVAVGASKNASLLSSGLSDHHLKIEYGSSNILFADTMFKGFSSNFFIKNIPVTTLDNTTTNFTFTSVADPGFTSNRTAVGYIYLKYPHLLNMEGKNNFMFYLPDNTAGSSSFLNLSNFNASGTVHLYDLSNNKRIKVVTSGTNYKALVPNSSSEKKCFITSEGNISYITSVIPVTPTAQFTDYGIFSADSAYVIVTNKALMASALDYKTYRSSVTGGMHNVLLADIDELYDQFAFGIVKSPLAIRGLADYLLNLNPAAPPKNLFLLGKSIHLHDCRQNFTNYNNCLVPSFGNPSSDNLITGGLNGTNLSPAIPTGRLSAKTNAEVTMYLEKIQEYESLTTPEEWMKYALHFGGGINYSEQTTFKNFLNSYKNIFQDVKFGGKVIREFFKSSPAPITINSSDTLRDLINNGVSLMTFFGHASGTGFDQSIDDWSTYNPLPGRYPFLLANSCYAGDFHSTGISSSESYTFLDHNGVIGYLGSVGLGVPFALHYFSSEFYSQLAFENYNKTIGTIIQKTIEGVEPIALNMPDSLTRETCYEMSLQGDPALKIHSFEKPDYKITNNDVYFDMTSDVESISVYAIRTNLGRAVNDSIFTEVLRILPNGDSLYYLLRNIAPKFKDTIMISIPVDYVNGVGLNKIQINLDRNNEVGEILENNNSTTLVDLLISGGTIAPVYPYEFAIIPDNTVTLKASTANPFAALKSYRFQLDTTDTFDSPFKKDTLINSIGGVVQWNPGVTLSDTTVYYWRVSPDSISPTNTFAWRESSFQYIPSKRGWEQAHFFQFKNDDYQYVKFNRPSRTFDFVNDIKDIYCKNGIYPNVSLNDIFYKVNGNTKHFFSWMYPRPGFIIAVIDPVGGEPMKNYPTGFGNGGSYGSISGYPLGHSPEYAFEFADDNSNDRDSLLNFLDNVVPDGHYVLGYSQQFPNYSLYSPALQNVFLNDFGVSTASLPSAAPYIFWAKKAATSTIIDTIGTSVDSAIELNITLSTNWNEGYIASPEIGPAASWDSLSWRWHSIDGIANADSIEVKLVGIEVNGLETVITSFNEIQLEITNLGSLVDASVFPRIRLMAFMKDDLDHTPPQLDRWQVFYTPVPEAAVNPVLGYYSNDSLQEGDNLNIRLPIENISEYAFTQDSLLVTYWVEDAARVSHPLPSRLKKKPFNPSEILIDTISVNTAGYQGKNALWVEVNPVGQTRSQLEQYHFNNIIRIPFDVTADKTNPLLDVTFDGVHILNNDIVSAKPDILIRLKDENRFLALNDTNDFKIFIKDPSSAIAQRIYFGTEMNFTPASLPNNSCKISYTPTLYQDGTYQLLVQAKDKSDNQSGAIDYKINFEVINRSTITEVMNYPNPFSTATHFVFTLTGSEIPTNFKIQIMTITGKVVREIFQDELGPLHIGRNITEFAWNGKDEFGDQLANGVYLYRVITHINGSDIEKRQTEADQYFKKGWGKMYLMR